MTTFVDFMKWWRDELLGMLPDGLRLRLHRSAVGLSIYLYDNKIGNLVFPASLDLPHPVKDDPLAALQSTEPLAVPVDLYIPGDETLVRSLRLPVAVLENLAEVLSFEMDRQTPFKAEDVYFGYRVTGKSDDRQFVNIELCVVPRERLQWLMTAMQKWQLQQGSVTLNDDGLKIRMHPTTMQRQSSLSKAVPVIAMLVLSAAIIVTPFILQQRDMQTLQHELAMVRESTRDAQRISEQLNRHMEVVTLLTGLKHQVPPVIDVLNQVSHLLPDGTWLQQMEVKDNQVHLQGLSSAASSLIDILEASSYFRNARFSAQVSVDNESGSEQFRIVTDLVVRQP